MQNNYRWVIAAALVLGMIAGGVAWYQRPAARQARLDRQLAMAVRAQNEAAVVAALARGADPNARCFSAVAPSVWLRLRYPANARAAEQYYTSRWWPVLRTAALGGDAQIVGTLVDRGANVNGRDSEGRSVLAAAPWHPNVVSLLVERGADESSKSEALCGAALNGYAASARLLIAHGADVNTHTHWGRTMTPLMLACDVKQEATVRLLIQHGADVNFRSESHDTPLRIATHNRRPDPAIIQMLKQAGARQ